MDKKQFLSSGLLEQYVLGITDPDETRKVEHYLEKYPDLKTEVEGMRNAIEQYALEQAIPPPPHLKSRIIKNIESGSAPAAKAVRPRMNYGQLVIATVAALIFLVASMALYKRNVNLDRDYRTLEAEYALLSEQCEKKNQISKERMELYAFLKDGATHPVLLRGTTLAPEAEVIVYWNEAAQKAFLNPVNLPAPPPGKQYQIWADVEGEMINMGLLELQSTDLQSLTFIQRAESLNITIEPVGGSQEPTVAFLLANGKV